jgi:hypothetical protein
LHKASHLFLLIPQRLFSFENLISTIVALFFPFPKLSACQSSEDREVNEAARKKAAQYQGLKAVILPKKFV